MASTSQTATSAQEMIGKASDTAQEAIGQASDRAQEFAGRAADRAHEMAGRVGDRARDMARSAGQKAEDLTHRAGGAMESLGDTIRDKGPHEGTLGKVAGRVAQNLESGGHYLQDEGLSGMANDMTDLIRRNPIPALLIGIGIGFLIARATSSRS
jgi:hypothetical protein